MYIKSEKSLLLPFRNTKDPIEHECTDSRFEDGMPVSFR